MHLATFHNVFFFQQLMRDMRDAIISGHFAAWQADFFALYQDS
jgi:queuine/archaeosine tRNA-ribosyltransferase